MTGDEVARVAHGSDSLDTHEAHEHEEVTSPDQHRRTVSPRLARLGAIVVIIVLPLMAFIGNHQGGVEKIFRIKTPTDPDANLAHQPIPHFTTDIHIRHACPE